MERLRATQAPQQHNAHSQYLRLPDHFGIREDQAFAHIMEYQAYRASTPSETQVRAKPVDPNAPQISFRRKPASSPHHHISRRQQSPAAQQRQQCKSAVADAFRTELELVKPSCAKSIIKRLWRCLPTLAIAREEETSFEALGYVGCARPCSVVRQVAPLLRTAILMSFAARCSTFPINNPDGVCSSGVPAVVSKRLDSAAVFWCWLVVFRPVSSSDVVVLFSFCSHISFFSLRSWPSFTSNLHFSLRSGISLFPTSRSNQISTSHHVVVLFELSCSHLLTEVLA